MSEEKYTPGPWKIWENIVFANTPNQFEICLMNKNASNDVREANAKLIAASPDMFDLLIECETYFDNKADADHDENGYVPNEEMRLITQIRELFSKLPKP